MIGNVYNSILAQFEKTSNFNTVAIYNKQIQRNISGYGNPIFFPACYVEIEESNVGQIGAKLSASDLEIRFHIAMEEYDSADGNMDQNINIFTLRNDVKKLFSLFKLDTGGFFQWTGEDQDYQHTNLYHYVVTYKAHQIDLAAMNTTDYNYVVNIITWYNWETLLLQWQDINMNWNQLFTGNGLGLNIGVTYSNTGL